MSSPHLPFPLRIATTLVTASAGMIREDPREFAYKVSERIRQSKLPLSPNLKQGATTNTQKQLVKEGNLTEAALFADTLTGRRAQETLERLKSEIIPGLAIAPSSNPRPLFFLNNSIPFTQSGYTERTHNLLKALSYQGIEPRAVTRLGYPVLVGKFPTSRTDVIDGISYERLLPTVYPHTLAERDEVSIDLLIDAASRHHASLLHTTTDYSNAIVVSKAAKSLNIPWIYEVRGELEATWLSRFTASEQPKAKRSDFYQLARAQETQAMKDASAVIALSEVSKQSMIVRGVPADKIHVVPNAVDESLIGKKYDQNQIRRELGLPSGPIVGTVTSVVGYEGLDLSLIHI